MGKKNLLESIELKIVIYHLELLEEGKMGEKEISEGKITKEQLLTNMGKMTANTASQLYSMIEKHFIGIKINQN